jgi:hypothetical protein
MDKMKTIKIALVAVIALGTLAQGQPRYRQPDGYRNGGNQQYVIGQVLQDLNRATQRTRMDSRDFSRVTDISRTLQQFESRWAQGKFDKGKLDHAIETLQHLADSNRLPQQLRSVFYRDVNDLREFRANRGSYGNGYGDPYSYRR